MYIDANRQIGYNKVLIEEVAKIEAAPLSRRLWGIRGAFDIQTLDMIEGDIPAKGQALIKEWAAMYKDDLLKIWNTQEFKKIPPLE